MKKRNKGKKRIEKKRNRVKWFLYIISNFYCYGQIAAIVQYPSQADFFFRMSSWLQIVEWWNVQFMGLKGMIPIYSPIPCWIDVRHGEKSHWNESVSIRHYFIELFSWCQWLRAINNQWIWMRIVCFIFILHSIVFEN